MAICVPLEAGQEGKSSRQAASLSKMALPEAQNFSKME